MSFRFRRRIQLLPGVALNLSKTGPSLTLGPRGATLNISSRGKRLTLDMPGSGIYYTRYLGSNQDEKPKKDDTPPEDKLDLGLLERITTAGDEKAFVDALRALNAGDEAKALKELKGNLEKADPLFLRGALNLQAGNIAEATADFEALQDKQDLGDLFAEYEAAFGFELPITPEVSAYMMPRHHDALVTLAELYQEQGKDIIPMLEKVVEQFPGDVVAKVSLAEVLDESAGDDKAILERVIALAKGVTNESMAHAALLLYRGRALRKLGLVNPARDTLSLALRRTKDRPVELLHALRYERALVYDAMGEKSRAKEEFEELYAENPDFEDVRARVGLT